MASATTVFNFDITLSHIDRSVFESLNLHVAQHPSEAIDYLLTRVLAYCLEFTEGIEFTKGLQDSEVPAVWIHDLTGQLTTWIEVGAPSAERLHKASKSVNRVVVYTHKDPRVVLELLAGKRIQHAEKIALHVIDRTFLAHLVPLTTKRNNWELSVSEGHLYLTSGSHSLDCQIVTHFLQ